MNKKGLLISALHKLLKRFGYKVTKRRLIDTVSILFKNPNEMDDNPLFKTRIIIKCFNKGKICAPIIEDSNNCVYNGRVFLQDMIFGHTPNPENYLTINKLLDITHSVDIFESPDELNRKIRVDYFCIGNGAESKTVSGEIVPERTSDTKLYNMVPFRCVPVGSDLTEEERKKYRLRKQIQIKGQNYIAYYAKAITKTPVNIKYNGQNYIPKETDTSTLPDTDPSKPLRAGNISIFTQFELFIEEKDFKEYYQAMNNNSLTNASLTEVGLISAYDVENANEANKKELAGATLFAKMCFTKIAMDSDTNSAQLIYELHT